jgi:2-C-methyl-D-erythritol 4-phosphate cytidylyltransferase
VQLDETEKFIQAIPNRKQLRRGQTPQFFPTKLLKKVYSIVEHRELSTFNDECGLVLRVMPNARIATVDGSEKNLKITTQQDSLIAEQLLRTPTLLSAGNFEKLDNPEIKFLIIIGGESGIGKAVKEISARAGVEVASLSRRNGYDINLQSGRDAIAAYFQRGAHKECHLVITAGILEQRALKELDTIHLEKVFTTNLLSPALLIGELANLDLLPNSITLVGSTSYLKSRHSMFAYSASKSGLISLLQSFIQELGGSGTRINVIVPERTDTEMRKINFNDSDKTHLVAEEVALGILECVATPINGQTIQIRSRR